MTNATNPRDASTEKRGFFAFLRGQVSFRTAVYGWVLAPFMLTFVPLSLYADTLGGVEKYAVLAACWLALLPIVFLQWAGLRHCAKNYACTVERIFCKSLAVVMICFTSLNASAFTYALSQEYALYAKHGPHTIPAADRLAEELIEEDVFAALYQHFPASFVSLVEGVGEKLDNGYGEDQGHRLAHQALSNAISVAISISSDSAILHLAEVNVLVADSLAAHDPALCAGYFSPDHYGIVDAQKFLDPIIASEVDRAMVGVIESAATSPSLPPAQEDVVSAVLYLHGAVPNALVMISTKQENVEEACQAYTKVFAHLLEHPMGADVAGLLLRALLGTIKV